MIDAGNQNIIVRVLDENLEMVDDLEWLDETDLVPIDDLVVLEESSTNKTLIENQHLEKPLANEEKSINKTLAEMSFMEANELFANGNYEVASNRYREASNYCPDNIVYKNKLEEILRLIQEKKSPTNGKYSTAKLNNAFLLKPSELSEAKKAELDTAYKNLKDTSEISINETLAEMSFMEAEDLVIKGDFIAAIERYKEAVNYSPNNNLYTSKLNAVLNELKTSKTTALKKTDVETSEKPSNIQEEKPSSQLNKHKKSKTANLKTSISTVGIDTPLSLGNKKTTRSKNYVLLVILLAVIATSFALMYQSTKVTLTLVQLSFPTNQAKLNKNQLEFEWQSKGDNFLFQIEYLGENIVEAYTQETRYKLSDAQIKLIKPKTSYKWKVVPVDFKGQVVPHKGEEKWFEVVY